MAKKYKDIFTKGSLIKDKGLIQHEQIKQQIKVLPELEAFIPPLKEEEFLQLESNIQSDGCREPLLVWDSPGGYILIDGHNRYKICQKHGIDFKATLLQFENERTVREWMLDNQLGRRNLTSEQSSYLRGLRYQLEKSDKGGYKQVRSKGQNDPSTAQKLAKDFHVSEKTIKRDAQFAEGIERIGRENPDLKQRILSGEIRVNKADIRALTNIDRQEVIQVKDANDLAVLLNKNPDVPTDVASFNHTKAQVKRLASLLKQGDHQAYEALLEEVKRLKKYI